MEPERLAEQPAWSRHSGLRCHPRDAQVDSSGSASHTTEQPQPVPALSGGPRVSPAVG